uniref:NAD(P)-binding protein n=1 Tax=Panagrolaimus sp. JU765 TaxID=591449 RepID=A0AC34QU05_9BILA
MSAEIALILIRHQRHKDLIINACCPGFVATDLTKHRGYLTIQEGADTPVYLATHEGVPKGEFLYQRKVLAWSWWKLGPLAGENLKANEWVYRGALELQLKPATDEEMEAYFAMLARESETDVPAVKSTDHVQFDTTKNDVWGMGSGVEKVYDKLLPPKPRSSMPSKYANAGSKIPAETKEQMRDKAIRED